MSSGVLIAASEPTATAHSVPSPARPGRLRRPRRGWVLGGLAVVVFAAGLGYLTGNETQANTQYAEAHASLNVEHQRIEDVLALLASVSGELHAVNGHVNQATTALADDALELQAAQAALTQAQLHVAAQGFSITALQSCLGGVEQALNALSVGDQGSALTALKASTASCQSAVVSSG